jgi:hypothetical protein
MATTFLSNATINFTQGATTYDLTSQANAVTLTIGFDSLESTAFGDTGHIFTKGLQTVDVSMTLFLSYGSGTSAVEHALADMVGKGTTTLTISPSGTTESASNPEYVISNLMISDFTPINSTVGELSTVEISAVGGTWVRDITAP